MYHRSTVPGPRSEERERTEDQVPRDPVGSHDHPVAPGCLLDQDLGVLGTGQAGMTAAETALYKTGLDTLLTDDVLNASNADPMELAGNGENDAKGWYVVLAKQGLASYCSHCQYETAVSTGEGERDYHVGEKVLGKLTLYAGNLYFTTYQPSFDDPCNPQGNAFIYAVDYLDASAALNYNTANGSSGDDKDVSDRYCTISGIKGLPSGFEIVTRDGEAGALANAGGKILGGEIPGADSGISLYYWIERD